MTQSDDSETIQRLTERLAEAEARRVMAEKAVDLQGRSVLVVVSVLFIFGSLIVLLITGRPSLLIVVALICVLGGGIALIGSRPAGSTIKSF